MKKLLLICAMFVSVTYSAEWIFLEELDLPEEKNSQKIYVDLDTAELRENSLILVKTVGVWKKKFKDKETGERHKSLALHNLVDCKNSKYQIIGYVGYRTELSPKGPNDIVGYGPWPDQDWLDKEFNEKLFELVCGSLKIPQFDLYWRYIWEFSPQQFYIALSSMDKIKEENDYSNINFYHQQKDLDLGIHYTSHFNISINCKKKTYELKRLRLFFDENPNGIPELFFSDDYQDRTYKEIMEAFRYSLCNGEIYLG